MEGLPPHSLILTIDSVNPTHSANGSGMGKHFRSDKVKHEVDPIHSANGSGTVFDQLV